MKYGRSNIHQQFDAIDLSKQANRSLNSVPFVDFEKFQVVNSTAAMKSGMLNESDWNCAESSPNFILSIPSEYTAPSIFHTNDKKLSAAGLSKYVDLVSFTIKPLRSNAEFGGVDIAAWEVDGKHADNVQELYLGFFKDEDTNAFNPFPIAPRDYFEGWGEKVNWIEMSAYTIDDEDNLNPWEFCLDNIVFEVREKRDDE